jgi:fructose-specific phosphotransferase system IIC component
MKPRHFFTLAAVVPALFLPAVVALVVCIVVPIVITEMAAWTGEDM